MLLKKLLDSTPLGKEQWQHGKRTRGCPHSAHCQRPIAKRLKTVIIIYIFTILRYFLTCYATE
jgi:hypothetical protein